jgi:signal transduction histidine kinase
MALSLPDDARSAEAMGSALQMAAAAVDRLDREINGVAVQAAPERVAMRPIVEFAIERWRGRAAAEGRSLRLSWNAGEPELRGDEVELAQAVDNLISNAFEHGAGEVAVDVRCEGGSVRVEVHDGGGGAGAVSQRARRRDRDRIARRRHGHGLRIVRRAAARHGGSFRLRRSARGSGARLLLPLAGGPR